MKKIEAFDNIVYKCNIFDDNLSIAQNWVDLATAEITKPEVLLHQSCNLDKGSIDGGMLWSTFETTAKSFFSFPDSDILLQWIKQKVTQVAPEFGFTNNQSAELTIDWMNIMYKNSFANCHTHDDESEPDTAQKVVVIFYLHAPKDSASLLVVKNTRDYSSMGVSPFTIPQDEIYPVLVTTGDLIIHKVDLPHAIDKHLSNEPRLCLVMEFRV
jgi:hypothetical protein